MALFSKLFGAPGRKRGLSTGQPQTLPALDEILSEQARRLRAADPDTGRQWQYVNVALQRSAVAEKVRKPARGFNRLNPGLAYGGTLAIVLLVAALVWLNRSSIVTYETVKGQQASIMLSDSSEVTLNHTSFLVVESRPFGSMRRVSLKGEAYFHVRKNGSPFVVMTDAGTVQVLGTRFDVRARGGQLVVGVVSGSVKVTGRLDGRDSSIVLTAGQIVSCNKDEYPGSPAALPFAEYPGWTQGKFLFYKTDLLAACKEIESQFDVQIRIDDPRVAGETITGVVDGQSVQMALTALSNLTGSQVRHENSVYTLY